MLSKSKIYSGKLHFSCSLCILLGVLLLQGDSYGCSRLGFFIQDGLLEGVNIEAAKQGDTMPIAEFNKQAKDYPYSVIVGKSNEPNIAALLKEHKVMLDPNWLGEQGFQIHSWKNEKNITTLVTGVTDVGVLYGLLDLPLQTEYLGFDTVDEYLKTSPCRRDRPFFQLRRGLLSDRANFNMPFVRNTTIYEYDEWPEVFENEEQKSKVIEEFRLGTESFERMYRESEQYGAKLFLWVYEPTFIVHSERFYKTHPEADARDNGGFLNPSAEIVKTIIREKYRQIWRRYPKLGGVFLSFKNGGRSYLTPSNASKPTHKPYDSAVEYINIIESAMREYNPDACVIVRAWKLEKSSLELEKLSKVLPPSVRYGCKATCPPGNDYLWHDLFTPYLKKMPNLFLNGQAGYNTDGPGDVVSHLCYEGPKQYRRAMKIGELTNYGAWPGDVALESYIDYGKLRYVINVPSRRSRVYIGWDPYNFDPNIHIAGFGKREFGEKAGKHFAAAMKDIWKVTDAMVFMPEWTDGKAWTNQLHFYHFFPWKKTGYATGIQQPKNFASITPDNPEFESFYKRLDIADAVALAEYAVAELEKAAQSQPKNPELLQTYLKAAKTTAHLTRAWRNYHLGLLYHNAVKNAPKHSDVAKYQKKAVKHMTDALSEMWKYRDGFFEIYPDIRSHAKYRGKHPKLYLSFVTQEIQDGYHNVVLAPGTEKLKPVWRLSSYKENVPQYSDLTGGAKTPLKTIAVIDVPDGELCPLISPNILPELNLIFEADLTAGAIVKVAERTWLDRNEKDESEKYKGYQYNFGIADVEVLLDGKVAGQITEYGELYTEKLTHSWIRYIVLPPAGKGKHTLTLRSLGLTGMELHSVTLYAQDKPLSIKLPQSVTDSFSKDPRWQTKRTNNSKMKMRYGEKGKILQFDLWREKNAQSTFYKRLPMTWSEPVCCEFDLRVDSVVKKSMGTIGMLLVSDENAMAHAVNYKSEEDNPMLLASEENAVTLRLYGESPEAVSISPSDAKLQIGRWYNVRMQRRDGQLAIVIKHKDGGIVAEYNQSMERVPEQGFDAFGVTNRSSSSQMIGPMKITIDNLQIGFF
ncbi:MAG: hypothetical protein PHF37_09745 [Phycisphaerae bacterium]|nr:hypothetical protein [Phycisphaerae bacterium]